MNKYVTYNITMEAPLQERVRTRQSQVTAPATRTTQEDYFSTVINPLYTELVKKYNSYSNILEMLRDFALHIGISDQDTRTQHTITFPRGNSIPGKRIGDILTGDLVRDIKYFLNTKCGIVNDIISGLTEVEFTIAEGRLLSPVDILLLGFINEIVTFDTEKYREIPSNETIQRHFKKRLDCIAACFGMEYGVISGRFGYKPENSGIDFSPLLRNHLGLFPEWRELLRKRNTKSVTKTVYDFRKILNTPPTEQLLPAKVRPVKTIGLTNPQGIPIKLFVHPYKSETIKVNLVKKMTIPTYIAVYINQQQRIEDIHIKDIRLVTFEQLKQFQRDIREDGKKGGKFIHKSIHKGAMSNGPTVVKQFNSLISDIERNNTFTVSSIWGSYLSKATTELVETEKPLVELLAYLCMAETLTDLDKVVGSRLKGLEDIVDRRELLTFITNRRKEIEDEELFKEFIELTNRARGDVGGYRKRKNKRKSSRRKTTRRKSRKKSRKKTRKKSTRRKSR